MTTQTSQTAGYTDSTAGLIPESTGYRPLEWTDELVGNLWQFYAATEPHNYYAARFGKALFAAIEEYLPAEGMFVDYGCGSGDMTALLASKRPALAVDIAPTLEETQPKLEAMTTAHPIDFMEMDAVTAPQQKVGALFMLEVIEHLLPHWQENTFSNIRTLVPKGSVAVISTPNDENVRKAMTCCPVTRTYYHKYQHMRTFTAASLAETMEAEGFETVSCDAYNLGMVTPYAKVRQAIRTMRGNAATPHLIYVGRRV